MYKERNREENKFIDEKLLTIHAVKVSEQIPLSPQIMYDMKVTGDYDPALRRGLLNLRTYLYKSDVQKEIKEVPFEGYKTVTIPLSLYVTQTILAMITLGTGIFYGSILLAAVAITIFAFGLYLFLKGFDHYFEGKAEISKEVYYTFPDNTILFPETLGEPSPQIVYGGQIKDSFYGGE